MNNYIILYNINWGALDHASCAAQLMSCNYYVHVHVSEMCVVYCVCVLCVLCVCVYGRVDT